MIYFFLEEDQIGRLTKAIEWFTVDLLNFNSHVSICVQSLIVFSFLAWIDTIVLTAWMNVLPITYRVTTLGISCNTKIKSDFGLIYHVAAAQLFLFIVEEKCILIKFQNVTRWRRCICHIEQFPNDITKNLTQIKPETLQKVLNTIQRCLQVIRDISNTFGREN